MGAAFAGTRIGEHLRHLPIPGARNPTSKLHKRPYLQPPSSSPPEMPILRRLFGVTNPVEGWRWEESDGGHRLLDRQGRTAAWIEGGFGNGNWRIIHPRAYPVPAPVPDLETAKRRARDMALCALPLDRQAAEIAAVKGPSPPVSEANALDYHPRL